MFPYEFNYPYVFKPNFYGNLLFIFGAILIMAIYDVNPVNSIYSYATIVISILLTMLSIVIILLPLRYLKTHLATSCVLMVLSVTLPLFNFLMAFEQFKNATEAPQNTLAIISMVISGILALAMMLLILNPKLTFKIHLDKTVDEQGNEVLVRPKIIYLALTEWWAIFTYFVSPLAVILLTII